MQFIILTVCALFSALTVFCLVQAAHLTYCFGYKWQWVPALTQRRECPLDPEPHTRPPRPSPINQFDFGGSSQKIITRARRRPRQHNASPAAIHHHPRPLAKLLHHLRSQHLVPDRQPPSTHPHRKSHIQTKANATNLLCPARQEDTIPACPQKQVPGVPGIHHCGKYPVAVSEFTSGEEGAR